MRDIIRTEYMNVGPGSVQELTSEEDYIKMGGGRVSVLFIDLVGCEFFLFFCSSLPRRASALYIVGANVLL